MRHEDEVKELLIRNAVRSVAKGGFENATTRELAFSGGALPDLRMNEVYIYRLFGGKEDLYEHAFGSLDREIFSVIKMAAAQFDSFEQDTREKLLTVFNAAWQLVAGNEDFCRFYVRYYYSAYFKGRPQRDHRQLFDSLIVRLVPLFKEDADVVAILHSVFTATFDFAIRVHNGELEDNDENRQHVFHVLYCMMVTYFKGTECAP